MKSPYQPRSKSEMGEGLESGRELFLDKAMRLRSFLDSSKEDKDSQKTTELHSKLSRASKNSEKYLNYHNYEE